MDFSVLLKKKKKRKTNDCCKFCSAFKLWETNRQTTKYAEKKEKLVSGNKTNSCYKLHAPTDTHTLTHSHSFADTHTHTYICIVSRQSCVLKEKEAKTKL